MLASELSLPFRYRDVGRIGLCVFMSSGWASELNDFLERAHLVHFRCPVDGLVVCVYVYGWARCKCVVVHFCGHSCW